MVWIVVQENVKSVLDGKTTLYPQKTKYFYIPYIFFTIGLTYFIWPLKGPI